MAGSSFKFTIRGSDFIFTAPGITVDSILSEYKHRVESHPGISPPSIFTHPVRILYNNKNGTRVTILEGNGELIFTLYADTSLDECTFQEWCNGYNFG